jgi:hypothetical protein
MEFHGSWFEAGTRVWTSSGYKPINEIEVKTDLVMTHTGQWRPVKLIHQRVHDQDLYVVHVSQHPRPIVCNSTTKLLVNNNTVDVEISKLNINEHKVETIIEQIEKYPTLVNPLNINWTNLNIWFMLGYYLMAGSYSKTLTDNFLFIIPLHSKRNIIIDRLTQLWPTEFKPMANQLIYKVKNQMWADFLKSQFVFNMRHRVVPLWIHQAPKSMLMYFLEGYWYAGLTYFQDPKYDQIQSIFSSNSTPTTSTPTITSSTTPTPVSSSSSSSSPTTTTTTTTTTPSHSTPEQKENTPYDSILSDVLCRALNTEKFRKHTVNDIPPQTFYTDSVDVAYSLQHLLFKIGYKTSMDYVLSSNHYVLRSYEELKSSGPILSFKVLDIQRESRLPPVWSSYLYKLELECDHTYVVENVLVKE